MTRRILTGVLFCCAISVAQARPNFSGTWNLNASSSDFGPLPRAQKNLTVIQHADPAFNLTSEVTGPQGTYTVKLQYSTDGKETTNVNGPANFKSTAKWEGNVLVIESQGKMQDREVKAIDKWSVTEDGKTLRNFRHLLVVEGEFDQSFVYDKQ